MKIFLKLDKKKKYLKSLKNLKKIKEFIIKNWKEGKIQKFIFIKNKLNK